MLRRCSRQLQLMGGAAYRREGQHNDPVMAAFDIDRRTVAGGQRAVGDDFSLGTEDLSRWMEVKQAAQILKIPKEDLYGLKPNVVQEKWHHVMSTERLTHQGQQEATIAAEVLMHYSRSEEHEHRTRAHYRRLLTIERKKLSDDMQVIGDEYVMKAMRFVGVGISICMVIMVVGGTAMYIHHPDRMQGIAFKVSKAISDATSIKMMDDPGKDTGADELPHAAAVEDVAVVGEVQGGGYYEELVHEAQIDLQRERDLIDGVIEHSRKQ
eukprot:PhM_4_TR5647/c0_g1_i1/m.18560